MGGGGGLQIDRLLRGETVVFAVELDEVESTRAAAASGDDRKKDRETEVGERRLMAASAAKRERRLKESFRRKDIAARRETEGTKLGRWMPPGKPL